MKGNVLIYIVLIAVTYSCTKDGSPVYEALDSTQNNGEVYVLNEGAFGQSNATIDQYDPVAKVVERGVYKTKNGNSPGDVVLSMTASERNFFVVVNNSGTVQVCDLDMNRMETISGFRSPRYLQIINSDMAYVSNFLLSSGINEIDVVDINEQSIVSKIEVQGWCEQMTMLDNFVYVLNPGMDKVLKIDVTTHTIVEETTIGKQPLSMQWDKHNNLWVLCTGGFGDELAQLSKLDPNSMQVLKTLAFNSLDDFPTWLSVNANGDSLYYLNDGVFALSIEENKLPDEPFIANNMTYMYAMSIDASTNTIYISDGKDFQQAGEIYHFTINGELINLFDGGIGPGNFYFHN